jgi:hypothetical protein
VPDAEDGGISDDSKSLQSRIEHQPDCTRKNQELLPGMTGIAEKGWM